MRGSGLQCTATHEVGHAVVFGECRPPPGVDSQSQPVTFFVAASYSLAWSGVNTVDTRTSTDPLV